MAVTEFIKELERKKAEQAKLGGFNDPAPVASSIQPQAPQELSAPQVGPTLANEVQPDALAGTTGVQAPSSLATDSPFSASAGTVNAPSTLTADSLGPVTFPGLQQQAADTRLAEAPVFFPGLQEQAMNTRLEAAGEEQQRLNEMSRIKTDAMVEKFRSGDAVSAQTPESIGETQEGVPEIDNGLGKFRGDSKLKQPDWFQKPIDFAKKEIKEGFQEFKPSLVEPTPAANPMGVTPEVTLTPEDLSSLSVDGKNVVTPEAITEAAPTPVDTPVVTTQAPTIPAGGMITRDSTGESFIGGSPTAATPEQVAQFEAGADARRAEYEERIKAENPEITQAQVSAENAARGGQAGDGRPVRQSTRDRDIAERKRASDLRKEGQNSIDEKMREFNREPHSMKERAAYKASLQQELNASIKEDRDFNRATSEAQFASDTQAYNRNTLNAAQQRAADIGDRDYAASQAEAQRELSAAETEKFNTIAKEGQRLDSQLSFLTDAAVKMSGMQDWSTEGFAGWAAEKLPFQTKAAQVNRLATSFQGNAFLRSIIDSKSLGATFGALSDTEGTKITAAEAILMDTKMGNEERMEAAKQIIDTISVARKNAQERLSRAGGGGQEQAAPRQIGNVPQVEGVTITAIG